MLPYREYVIWLLFLLKNNGILACLRMRNMVLAVLTYLDSFIRFVVRCYQKACSIESHGPAGKELLISTEPVCFGSIKSNAISYQNEYVRFIPPSTQTVLSTQYFGHSGE